QQRLEQFEKLFGNSTTASVPTTLAPVVNPHNFDLILVAALLVALTPFSVDTYRAERRRRKNEADFADFLFEMSELIRGGIDPVKAVNTLAEGDLGTVTQQVRVASKQMQLGYTFEQAMRNLATSLNSALITRYVDLVIQASYSGGGVSNLIQRASADMSTFIALEGEKRAGLAQYTMILYVGQFVLVALAAILVIQFVPELSGISALTSGTVTGGFLSNSDIANVPLERDLFFLCVINGLLGGLVIGKISEGKIKHGIKHSLVLVLIAFLAWTLIVVPASSSAGPTYPFAVVSYDKSGPVSLPLPDPIVVQVNNTDGTPASNVLVLFNIAGPGGMAQVIPSSVYTDDNGMVSAQIILGNVSGTYTVGVTVGSNTTAVNILATGSNGAGG
ncbi:MAG TPA: type II secretion system F family protein, partial [Nitrososphaerales archaeon]|nr:type II secretion system F family protein [Nitrososphaerales archaeon]